MKVKMTRVYMSEDAPLLHEIFDYLHDNKIKGATIFRGVKGFGHHGVVRETRFLDLHFELPMILEFFDAPDKVDAALNHFKDKIEAGRVVQWFAEVS